LVPGYTDDPEMFKQMCGWILEKIGADHPLHLLRFFPKYKLNRLPPTPVELLESFRRTAMDMGIRYVYLGNVPGHEGSHTFCHNCKRLVIERKGYRIDTEHMEDGTCRSCGEKIPGVWH
jgi:pyruvate formate lyase activating enzyme